MDINQKIDSYLKTLALHHIGDIYLDEAEKAIKAKLSYQDYLLRLLEQQIICKIDRSINRRIQIAGFPVIKKLEEFDFSFQPQIDEKLIRELANLYFLNDAKNIILLGPPGVGKTHLAIALGLKACQAKKKVLFYSASSLANDLALAEVSGLLNKKILSLSRADLLIIDELGYLDLSKKVASLFFQLFSKRYENCSTIITSNKPFDEWSAIFNDDAVATAILDRLLHHSYSFFIQGKSYRLKQYNK
jgi:DNA replication protein DnaC